MKKILLLAAILMLMTASMASAQTAITPGAPVEAEITDAATEVLFTFSGTKGTPYIIEMRSLDTIEGFTDNALTLVGPDGAVITDTDATFQTLGGYGSAYIAVILPADGEYTVTAKRSEFGTSVGAFTMTLIEPTVLEPETRITGEITSDREYDFYIYTPKEEFYVNFWRNDGDFAPELSVNAINEEDGELEGLGYAFGTGSNYHALGFFEAGPTYFIVVGQAEASFGELYFDEEMAAYELEIRFPLSE